MTVNKRICERAKTILDELEYVKNNNWSLD